MNKKYRMTSSKSFDYAHKRGKSISDANLVLIYVPTKYNLKVGFSVSKKVGKAVVRGKVKRRLKEGFRLLIPYINGNFNYVFLARNNASSCNYHELMRSMVYLLRRVNLVTNVAGLNEFLLQYKDIKKGKVAQ